MPRSKLGEVLATVKGFSMQALRPEYAGEDKKVGWRADNMAAPRDQRRGESDDEYAEFLRKRSDPARRQAFRESDQTVTKYYNDAEREASKVSFDEQGRAVGASLTNDDGTMSGAKEVIAGKTRTIEYVADAEGTVHQFAPGVRVTGEKMTSPLFDTQVEKRKATHHSSVLAGDAVSAAGEMTLDYHGYVTEISNKSGHYKPGAIQVIQLLEELARKGALLDKSYVMPNAAGKAQPLAGKVKEIHEAILKVQGTLQKKLGEGKDVAADLAAIEKGKQALAKLGAGPANSFRDVDVQFVDGADKKTGAAVRTASASSSTADEFLRSGAGATTKVTETVQEPDAGAMPDSFRYTSISYTSYPPETLALRLGIDIADIKGAEDEPDVLYAEDLLKDPDLKKKMGVNSVEEIFAKISKPAPGEKPKTVTTVTTVKRVADLKNDMLDQLQRPASPLDKKRPKTLVDEDSDQRADELPAKLKAAIQRLPQVLAWYRSELKKAESDKGPDADQRRKELAAGIKRVEAAMNPTDVSEAALTKVLSELEAQFERVQRAPPAWSDRFGNILLQFEHWPVEFFAKKLGLTIDEVNDVADTDPDGIWPADLLTGDYPSKTGAHTLEELYKKLFS